ncbi:hypothetical protein ACFFIX_19770 [Metabacillus herbersteinensis]|uniref:Uncharacterized protein n=1 Tax=Metabacillus herbersteinensis TaxID=283816 RepID=A0ABV6GIY2_9BACI
MKNWMTPEEAEIKKQKKKTVFYVSVPFIVIAMSILVTFTVNSL